MHHVACRADLSDGLAPLRAATVAGMPTPLLRRLAALTTPVIVAATLAACGPDPSGTGPSPDGRGLHLSIGDSYAAGFRPALGDEPEQNTIDGFAWEVAEQLDLELENVACAGITAVDYVLGDPCEEQSLPPGTPARVAESELDRVEELLATRGAEVELVTIVLGVNDVLPCLTAEDWRGCARRAMVRVTRALDRVLDAVARDVPAGVPVLGLTYPDVFLGETVTGRDDDLVEGSLELFRDIVNPALARVYRDHGARLVDVTAGFDAYAPVSRTARSERHGTLPLRAATICDLTYYCSQRDIHPTPTGHDRIAELVLAARRAEVGLSRPTATTAAGRGRGAGARRGPARPPCARSAGRRGRSSRRARPAG